jgi:hypothetical protein
MSKQHTSPDAPEKEGKKSGRDENQDHRARDSTSINPEQEEPIDPEMPDMPPA